MDWFTQMFTGLDPAAPNGSVESLVLSLLLAFVLGQGLAWTYARTHTGLSYSRSFTQSLVLMMMAVSLVLFVIGNSLITAFGLIGAMALIRFRNVLKDTRDTVFVFMALVLGMAAGSQRHTGAIAGTLALALVAFYLHHTGFGSRGRYDGHLTCRLRTPLSEGGEVLGIIHRFCGHIRRISTRHGAELAEYVFQIRLRDRTRGHELTDALRGAEGVGEVALVLRDELAEI